MKAKVTLSRSGVSEPLTAATGMLRESIGFVLTSFEKQLEGGVLDQIARGNETVDFLLRIAPLDE